MKMLFILFKTHYLKGKKPSLPYQELPLMLRIPLRMVDTERQRKEGGKAAPASRSE